MATTVTDPVCGMEIVPGEAAGTSEYEGTVYYFCSETCKSQFEAEPWKYMTGGEKLREVMQGAPMEEKPAKKWWEFWK